MDGDGLFRSSAGPSVSQIDPAASTRAQKARTRPGPHPRRRRHHLHRIAESAVSRATPRLAAEDKKMKAILLAILSPPSWTILGLALTLVGLFLLFLFGMPYSLRPDGGDYLISES